MFTTTQIRELVEKGLAGSRAIVRDLTGTQDHFELVVVADAFEGRNPVERHRMVYKTLGPSVGAEIHALSLKTMTSVEAKKEGL